MAYTADTNEPKVVATIGGIVFPRKGNPGSNTKPDKPHAPVYRYSGGVDSSGNKEGGAERKLTQAIMANDLSPTAARALDKRAWKNGVLTAGRGFVPPAAPPGPGTGGGSDDPDADGVETDEVEVECKPKAKKKVSRKKRK